MKKMIDVLTGSRLYGTQLENSNEDRIEVYVSSWRDLTDVGQTPHTLKDVTSYELTDFLKAIQKGDLSCHQVLWTAPERFKIRNVCFHELYTNRIPLISYDILQGWLCMAEYLFGKAIRIGALKLTEKSAYDFMTFHNHTYQLPEPMSVRACMDEGKFDSYSNRVIPINMNKYGLKPIKGLVENMYLLFENYSNYCSEQLTNGLLDANGNIKTIPEGTSYTQLTHRGYIYYDKKRHDKYINFKKQAKLTDVSRGYASFSAYHAFRYLDCVMTYLKASTLPTYTTNNSFLMSIRKHNLDITDMTRHFAEELGKAKQRLKDYDGQKEVNTDLIKDIIVKIRGPVELSKSSVDSENELENPLALDGTFVNGTPEDNYKAYYEGHGV